MAGVRDYAGGLFDMLEATPYTRRTSSDPTNNGTGNIGDPGYGWSELGQDVEEGVTNVINPLLGQPTMAERRAQQALASQFAQMAEAYRQYRGLNATSQQATLNGMLQTRAPVQEVMGLAFPGIQQQDYQGLRDQLGFNADLIRNYAGLNGQGGGATGGQGPAAAAQGWPVVHNATPRELYHQPFFGTR